MTRPGLPILIIVLLGVALSFFRDPAELISPTDSIAERQRDLPQTYVEEARSLTFDEYGVLTEIMEADRVEQYQKRDEALLTAPRFYSHNGDDKTWSASADRGHFRPSNETLTLEQNVVLTNDISGGRLATEKMTIQIANKIAQSDVPVEITQGPNIMRADGMHANLEREQIRMSPNVESVYVRQQ